MYWEYSPSWCGRNSNRNIRCLVTSINSIEEGKQEMRLGYQTSRLVSTDLIFSSKVSLPKCSTSLKTAPQSGDQIFKNKSHWRIFHIQTTTMSNLMKFKRSHLCEDWCSIQRQCRGRTDQVWQLVRWGAQVSRRTCSFNPMLLSLRCLRQKILNELILLVHVSMSLQNVSLSWEVCCLQG